VSSTNFAPDRVKAATSFDLVFHVRFRDGWVVEVEGTERVLSRHPTKEDAVLLAHSLARRVTGVIVDDEPRS
jgi:hypothetical protein